MGAVKSARAIGRPGALAAAAAALLPFLVFLPAVSNGFVDWDDPSNFIDNPNYRGLSLGHLRWMWTTFHLGHYTPLAWMTLGCDYTLYGMSPAGYHFTNVLLHAACALIFFLIATRLMATRALPAWGPALAASLFFSVHPLRVESVAWITQRRDVLCGMFALLTVWAYLRRFDPRTDGRGTDRPGSMWPTFVFFLGAALSKALGTVLPVALLVIDRAWLSRLERSAEGRRALIEKIPFFAVSITVGYLAVAAQVDAQAALPLDRYPLGHRIVQWGYGTFFYPIKTLWPAFLCAFYTFPDLPPTHPLLWGSTFVAVALAAWAVAGVWARRPPAAAWLVFLLFSFPTSGLVQSGLQFVADRYSYVACLPFALMFGVGTERAARWKGRRIAAALAGVWLIVLAVQSWRQIGHWVDGRALWARVAAVYPDMKRPRLMLAVSSLAAGDLMAARRNAEAYVRLAPEEAVGLELLGNILWRQSDPEATRWLEAARKRDPRLPGIENELGAAHYQQGRYEEAARWFTAALEREPASWEIAFNQGLALKRAGRRKAAAAAFDHALRLKPDFQAAKDQREDCRRPFVGAETAPAKALLKNP